MGPAIIDRRLPDVAELYSGSIRDLTSAAIGTRVIPVPLSVERYVANILCNSEDEHGSHVDDYPIATTVLLDSTEGVDKNAWYSRDGRTRLPIALAAGDAYVLRASEVLHGVGPLLSPTVRIGITFAFTLPGAEIKLTSSAEILYHGET